MDVKSTKVAAGLRCPFTYSTPKSHQPLLAPLAGQPLDVGLCPCNGALQRGAAVSPLDPHHPRVASRMAVLANHLFGDQRVRSRADGDDRARDEYGRRARGRTALGIGQCAGLEPACPLGLRRREREVLPSAAAAAAPAADARLAAPRRAPGDVRVYLGRRLLDGHG